MTVSIQPLAEVIMDMAHDYFIESIADTDIMMSIDRYGEWVQRYSWPMTIEGQSFMLDYSATITLTDSDGLKLYVASLRDGAKQLLHEILDKIPTQPPWNFNLIAGDKVEITGIKTDENTGCPVVFVYDDRCYHITFISLITRTY